MTNSENEPNSADAANEENEKQPSPKTWKTRSKWLFWRVLRGYLIVILLLTLLQRYVIYHPKTVETLSAADEGLQDGTLHDFEYSTSDGLTMHGWHFLRTGKAAENEDERREVLKNAPSVVLYFSGNAGHRGYRLNSGVMFAGFQTDMLLADYRGYGDNPGSPTEEMLVSDAHALWAYAVHECSVPANRIVVYGESLGGGVAVRLTADLCRAGTPPQGLIVQSSFSSLSDVASAKFPWLPAKWLLWDRFDSEHEMADVTVPYLHLHGEDDNIVKYRIGEKLFAAAPEKSASGIAKEFVSLPDTGHNDVFSGMSSYNKCSRAIEQFLNRIREADKKE